MLNHQGMPLAATRRCQQHRFISHRRRIQQVKQVLEQARHTASKDRCSYDQKVSRFYGLQCAHGTLWQLLTPQAGADVFKQIYQVDVQGLQRQLGMQLGMQRIQQRSCFGGASQTAIQDDRTDRALRRHGREQSKKMRRGGDRQ